MRGRGHWVVFVAVVAMGAAAALALHQVEPRAFILFGDAGSHMVTARRVVDWADDPGLAQLGTNWLPLPHLMLLPFTLIEPMFTTGAAGLAVSLPCLAGASALLYRMIRVQLAAPAHLAAAGAALFALNPSILYLGLIAMTEAPFMLFFVGSAYFVQKWYLRPDDLRALAVASLCTAAATLCRYEGWVLPPLLAAIVSWRLARADLDVRKRVAGIAVALLAFVGIAVWVAYNAILYGDPLEFANVEYYSAASQARARDIRQTLFLQPANVAWVYGVTALAVYGPFLLLAAIAGYVLRWRKHALGPLLGYLALPPLFTLILLLAGIGEMTFWFNSRFLILLAPLVVVLAVVFVQRVRGRAWLPGLVAVCFTFYVAMTAVDVVPTYLDARRGFHYGTTPSAVDAAAVLRSEYDGGQIMLLTGSPQGHRIMVAAGIPLRRYDEVLESSTWKATYRTPWSYDRWLVISKAPDADAAVPVGYWRDRRAELGAYYHTVYENEFHEILRRR